MMRIFAVFLLAALAGCDGGFRNSPEQQIEDHAKCRAGGMESVANGIGEIWCVPTAAHHGKAVEP